jgi:hypothetical protein
MLRSLRSRCQRRSKWLDLAAPLLVALINLRRDDPSFGRNRAIVNTGSALLRSDKSTD